MLQEQIIRRAFLAAGQVQGVGFRPFVYRLAHECALTGSVGNTADGVRMEVQGRASDVRAFARRLREELPPLARLADLTEHPLSPQDNERTFSIVPSRGQAGHSVLVSPDMGVCQACLDDMRNPDNPRHAYPFTNCTDCGPRYTITRSIPYDRAMTSMSCFPLCPSCAAEYANPADRRFHAQPVACPACGPALWFVDKNSTDSSGPSPDNRRRALERAADILLNGGILALKGLGGFQLACDAHNPAALQELRRRKTRPHKPLALMTGSLESARSFCCLTPRHEALLLCPEKPIVLCPVRADAHLPREIAPDTDHVGLMLPNTPLHAVLFDLLAGQTRPPVLVMTSANAAGEPICLRNREALARLEHLADAWLLHDRDILVRVDDSVVALQPQPAPSRSPQPARPLFFRRARGYVPRPVFLAKSLTHSAPGVLGAGAGLKATVCLTLADRAFVSQHIGDLENAATLDFYTGVIAHLENLQKIRPQALVCDLHPDFLSTRYAEDRARRDALPLWRLQHHAAHAASVLAENGHCAPALTLCLDGTGLGDDGTIWGGELLLMDLDQACWQRLGRLSPFALPGGDAAVRQPWRTALALAARCPHPPLPVPWPPCEEQAAQAVGQMLRANVNCPLTSSCGRLFDAVAAQLGLCHTTSYEGQAAIRLEHAARQAADIASDLSLAWPVTPDSVNGLLQIDSARLFFHATEEQARNASAPRTAALFHLSLAQAFALMTKQAARQTGISVVALSGGVMQNSLLGLLLPQALHRQGLSVLTHHELPPGDGGLSLGQAVWGIRMLARQNG